MKPKPIYRSLTFWSGALVIGFICWGWWFSLGNEVQIGARAIHFWHSPGQIELFYNEDFNSNWEYWNIPRGLDAGQPAPPVWAMPDVTLGGPFPRLLIPHWLILLGVAIPWSALLFWRARRVRKAVATSQA